MVQEINRLMNDLSIAIMATRGRFPVFYYRSENANIEEEQKTTVEEVGKLRTVAPDIRANTPLGEKRYHLAIDAAGGQDTLVSRISENESIPNGINALAVADDIRKGAAFNAARGCRNPDSSKYMRIIGGEARGRKIHLPRGCRIRPTADRVKKSLFDILHPLTGKSFLDLFAGCGNVGLEALSRGACFTAFLEKNTRLADATRANLSLLGFDERAEVVVADVGKGLDGVVKAGWRFDIIFADPPYDEGFLAEIPKWLEGGDVLSKNGIVVIQHSVREGLPGMQPTLMLTDERRYGDTMLSFLNKKEG